MYKFNSVEEAIKDIKDGKIVIVVDNPNRENENNPRKIDGLESCGIEIVNRVLIQMNHNEKNEFYLQTKKEKLGHML